MRTMPIPWLLAAALVAGGCRGTWNGWLRPVGPDYCRPEAPVAEQWVDQLDRRITTDVGRYEDWWTVFNDPVLDDLVHLAYGQNLSLKVAGLRIVEARAQRRIAAGNLFPQLQQAFADYRRVNLSRTEANVEPTTFFDVWDAGFDLSWELDVWGRFRRAVESADANLNASVEDYDDVLVILIADVASTYVEIRAFEERIALAHKNVDLQRGSERIAQAQLAAGVVTDLDVQEARANLTQTQARIPLLEIGRRQTQNRLCVLLGIPTRDLRELLGEGRPVPSAPAEVAVGIPAELLRRRPDVRRAEREVAAQSARIGIAAADLYPRLALNGAIEVNSNNLSSLFMSSSTAGFIGPSLRWDILNYGRITNNIRVHEARFEQLVVGYENTVLKANQEAEDAMVAFLQSQQRTVYLAESAGAARRAVEIAELQYREEQIDLNRLFDLQVLLVKQEDQLAQSKADIAIGLVRLYKALGGGWQIRYGQQQLAADEFQP